jgi:hypothetical protein
MTPISTDRSGTCLTLSHFMRPSRKLMTTVQSVRRPSRAKDPKLQRRKDPFSFFFPFVDERPRLVTLCNSRDRVLVVEKQTLP